MSADLNKSSGSISPQAIAALKKVLDDLRAKPPSPKPEDWNLGQLVAAKAAVIPRYGPAFSPANVGTLPRETVLEFLRFKNNRHWKGLERRGAQLTRDLNRLREALSLLVDESIPLRVRLERLRPLGGRAMIPFLGPAVITAILHVVYPDRYGVFNKTLKGAMETLGIWPGNVREDSFADQYIAVNPMQLELASQLGLDLWTFDYLWWYMAPHTSPQSSNKVHVPKKEAPGIERKLLQPSAMPPKQSTAEPSFSIPCGLTFSLAEAESRLLRFCREEYIYYDGIADQVPARIEPVDVLATVAVNSFVNNAALVRKVHRGLATRCDALLAKIPLDADLMVYDSELTEFQRLIHAAVLAPQVLVAVATKVLHRKRRNFIVMIDSVFTNHYATAMKHPEWVEKSQIKASAAGVAVEIMKAFREDLRFAYTRLIGLQAVLTNAGYDLTPVRILEILVWIETEPSAYYRPS
jgi:hypothetical protein